MKKIAAAILACCFLAGCEVVVKNSPSEESFQPVISSDYDITTAPPATEPETEPETLPPSPAQQKLESMNLRDKVYQMFIVTPEALTNYTEYTYAGENAQIQLSQRKVGGIILFGDNLISQEQTAQMLGDYQNFSETGLFTAVDEEGGGVSRCAEKLGTYWYMNMAYFGGNLDYKGAFSAGQGIGSDIGNLGFNLDFAPVCDVNINPYNELGNRIFSSDCNVVSDMSAQVVKGLKSSGVCSTLKHFPGLGAENGNTHQDSVYIERSFEELSSVEFPAFQGGIDAGAEFVMVGHQITSAAGDNLPSDLSPVVITDWLRNYLGYQGIVITDSHEMGAISNYYTSAEAAVLSVKAGADMILTPANLDEAADGIISAVENGEIPAESISESLLRILELKDKMGIL